MVGTLSKRLSQGWDFINEKFSDPGNEALKSFVAGSLTVDILKLSDGACG